MAEKIDNVAKQGHNSEGQVEAIQKLDSDLIPLEAKVQAAKDAVRKKRQEFKASSGMALADFDAARRLANMDDDDEREVKVDNFRQCYNALVVGKQLDWIDAADKDSNVSPIK